MADINDNTINITISAPSADSNTISVVNPALKNNVVVNDARITPSERAKLAGIESGATADQVLTAGDNIVLSSGPDYTISLASSPSISGNLTVAGTSDFNNSMYFSGATLFLDRTGSGTTKDQGFNKAEGALSFSVINGKLTMSSSEEISISNTAYNGKITLDSSGDANITGKSVTAKIGLDTSSRAFKVFDENTYFNQDRFVVDGRGTTTLYQALQGGLTEKLFEVKANASSPYALDHVQIGPDSGGYKLPPSDGLQNQVLQTDGNGNVSFATLYSASGAPVPNQTNIQFLGADGNAISLDKIGIDGANDSVSINSTVSYGASGVNLFVDGGARIDGAIEVSSAGTVQYAFPTTDGTANQLLATDGSGAVTFVTPSTSNVTEGTNLYYTDARVAANSAVAANTAKTSFPGFGTTAGTALEGDTALFDGQYSSLTGIPSTFAPSAHTHTASEITDFDTEVSNNTSVAANTAKVGYTDAAVDSRIAAASIDDFSDVDTSTVAPTDGQALVWDNANSKWEPGTVSGGGSSPWTTSGSDIYYTTGNVGVGTTTPAKVFHAAGDSQIDGTLLVKTQYNAVILGSGTAGGGNSAQADGNVIIGHQAMSNYSYGNGTSYRNVAIGKEALKAGTGAYNVSVGRNSMRGNHTRSAVVGVGNASFEYGGGTHSVGVGLSAGRYATGDYNTLIGGNAGVGVSGSSTFANTVAVGYQALTALTTGAGNTAVGYQAGDVLTTGGSNTLLGHSAGGSITTASFNTIIGESAGASSGATSNGRTIVGASAGQYNSGSQNTIVGFGALQYSSASNSVAIGQNAAHTGGGSNAAHIGYRAGRNTSGNNNVTIGYEAGLGVQSSSTYENTVAVGYQALTALTTGAGNTAVGYQAGATLTTSNDNTFIGHLAGATVQTNTQRCVAVGREALNSATTYKAETVAIGDYAGNTSGQANAYVGYKAGNGNTGGDYNTGIGWNALKGFGTTYSTALGYSAGANSNGDYNVLLGASTGSAYNSSFSNTVAVGYQALTALTTGVQNTAVGYQAGDSITTTSYNTLIGYQAGQGYASPTGLVAIGSSTGKGSSPYSVFVGHSAGTSVTGQDNSVMGFQAMSGTGQKRYNVAIGRLALAGTGTSDSNVAIGHAALDANGNKSYNVAIGHTSGSSLTTGSSNVLIGYQSGSTLTTESNKLYIENSNSTTPLIYGEFDNDILKVNGTLEPTKGVVNEGGSGFASTGDYGSGAEITYLGSSSTSTFVGRVYYYDGTTWQAFSSSTEAAQKALLGIALGSTMASGFLLRGFIQPDGVSITAAQQVFGATNAAITGTAPTSGYQRVMGHAVSSTVIHFNPSQEYIDLV